MPRFESEKQQRPPQVAHVTVRISLIMNQIAISLLLVMVVTALPRTKRQMFKTVDPDKAVLMMNNEAHVNHIVNCLLLKDQAQVAIQCDKHGKFIRDNIPEVIKAGGCPTACNEKERQALVKMYRAMLEKYRPLWDKIIERYQITPEQLKKLDELAKAVPAT